ncbi:MAG: hypothetical protein ACJ8FY_28960 [Gemmataceae bacterium]
MNTVQRRIVIAGGLVMTALILCPPWLCRVQRQANTTVSPSWVTGIGPSAKQTGELTTESPSGHDFLWSPPSGYFVSDTQAHIDYHVDLTRLSLYLVAIAILTGILVFLNRGLDVTARRVQSDNPINSHTPAVQT